MLRFSGLAEKLGLSVLMDIFLVLVRCNENIVQNGTFFINRNYPKPDVQADVCQATIPRPDNVCQLRIDFIVFKVRSSLDKLS